MNNGHEYDQSRAYEIRVKGILDSSWSEWFDGFRITVQGDETILIGVVPDQSALHGILMKINDLGLSLINVSQFPREASGDEHERKNENYTDT